ncbi:hypothetical protein ACLSY8_09805 [Avibacterium avium]|uniref:Uncharacterized protein n=2 Tax=Avibacterium TaxID=292486 RepID=A0A379AU94_AVIAV|nr:MULTISPECIES: hypothetical protein [Avibacterium]MCW9715318.1 hypothetical protein [Avibacterium sp. 21-594]SUB24975.1 Uncharacterised protein [Avibacterium avium]
MTRRRKTFLKNNNRKLFRLAQGRALRLKRMKQRKTRLWDRHALQFVIQDICC